jgi:hypothetical protein
MTRNQRRAAALAQDLRSGGLQAADLSDTDWDLLLLAADLHDPRSVPLTVSSRVLERVALRTGFFTERATAPRTDLLALTADPGSVGAMAPS